MFFNTFSFIVFLILVVISYWIMPTWRGRKLVLLGASYLFYAAWSPPFVFLLALVSWGNWILARQMLTVQTKKSRRIFLIASLVFSLGLRGFFKYGALCVAFFSGFIIPFGGGFVGP